MERKTYESENLGVSFSLPERLTVREHMQFRARLVDALAEDAYTRYWLAVLPLVEDWQCEVIPDPAALDLDAFISWKVADVMQYVANTAAAHMLSLDDVPKNA